MRTSQRITRADGRASCFQKVAPRVLGIISERYRIARVNRKATRVSQRGPKTATAWAPTPAAPIVWAKVLSMRMLDMDSSRLSLTCFNTAARFGFWFSSFSTKPGVS